MGRRCEARARGRVAIFNATRPGGVDGWTMDAAQYDLVREHILETIDALAGADGTVALEAVVIAANERFAGHPLFPSGRMANKVRFVKVDLEARWKVERVPGSSPQRIRRADPTPAAESSPHPTS